MTTKTVIPPVSQEDHGIILFSREQESNKCTVPIKFLNENLVNLTVESLMKVVRYAMSYMQDYNLESTELHTDDLSTVMDVIIQLVPYGEIKALQDVREEISLTQKQIQNG